MANVTEKRRTAAEDPDREAVQLGAPSPDALFHDYRHDIYQWALRILPRHHEALDIAQDVFLKWHAQCRDEMPRHPRAWLRRTTINHAIDRLRARREKAAGGIPNDRAGASQSGAGRDDADQLRADIADAMSRLSDAQRIVLMAKVYDQSPFSQIAEELGVAVPTVKTHFLRAIEAMRDRLSPRWKDEGN